MHAIGRSVNFSLGKQSLLMMFHARVKSQKKTFNCAAFDERFGAIYVRKTRGVVRKPGNSSIPDFMHSRAVKNISVLNLDIVTKSRIKW